MTNEQLIRQYYNADEAALEKLYHKNIGLIRGIAKEAAVEFNCLIMEQHHRRHSPPEQDHAHRGNGCCSEYIG